MECSIQILEQPAMRVKFRMEVHSHRCQQKELLLGRNSNDDVFLFPTVQILPSSTGSRLREGTQIRMSLVDVRSTKDHIIEHWHRLVDCKNDALVAKWAVTKRMDADGRVTFGNLGIVRTLEKEKVKEVSDRIIERMEEKGVSVRNNKWECTQISNRAEQQCKETSAYRLKLCFEAFLPNGQGGTVKVAEHAFSEDVLDLTNMNTGELAIKKMSICNDFVEGGAEVMIFTGGDGNVNKISYARSTFHADFFQINPYDESRIWEHRVTILDNQLHGVGQHLGGVHFCVPPYDRQGNGRPTLIERESENVFMELIKTNKNNTTIQAKSDPLSFVYKPSAMTRMRLKRPHDPAHFATVLGKLPKVKEEEPAFVSVFPQQDLPIFQIDHEQLNIPQTVMHEPISFITQPQAMSPMNPFSPSSAMGCMSIQSPIHHPSSPAHHHMLSPAPQVYSTSPYGTPGYSPTHSPNLQHRSPGPAFPASQNPAQSTSFGPSNTQNGIFLNGIIDLEGIGTIDLQEITTLDLIGSISGNDYESYLQDGRLDCTVAMDGGPVSDSSLKKEIRRRKNDKKVRGIGGKEEVLLSMSKLKL